MTIKDFGDCIEFNIAHNLKHSVLGLGAPGIGKSQVIWQIGEKYGYKVIDIRLSQMSEVEIGGLIFPNEDKTKTRWLTPEILPDEERDGKKTILLLDEITSCTKRVQVAAYQLILDRRIGQYHLPEGTFVIALGNREEDDGVYVQMAGPLADRFEIHNIEVDFDCWKNGYALDHGIHPYVIKYLTYKPSSLHTQTSGTDEMVFATPRSWERVSDILNLDSDVKKDVIRNKIIGNIGAMEAKGFITFCQSKNAYITVDDVLRGCMGPSVSEQAVTLINALTDTVKFIKGYKELSDMKASQREQLNKVIAGIFRFPNNEHKMLGVRKLLGLNHEVVKSALYETDSRDIEEFVNYMHRNGFRTA
ncbi:AAA domain (dynein-related subfamily) [Lachnospiraceae bacterium XBB2008]|nr:AAA domain (dynein-related subfamily) [Lachnospiraceae bacterium XBB2008]